MKADVQPATHLDGGTASLTVSLGVVDVSRGDEATFREYREQHRDPGGQLLDVDVAGELARGDGAKPLAGDGIVGRNGIGGVGGQGEAASLGEGTLPFLS